MAPPRLPLKRSGGQWPPFKSAPRSSQEKRRSGTRKWRFFRAISRPLPLFGGEGTDIYLVNPPATKTPRVLRMRAILEIIVLILDLYVWLLIASAILSWLIAFNVVNTRNQLVAAVAEFLYRITEPVLAPIRNFLPNLGGLDISPIILILIIMFLERVIMYYIYPIVF